MNYHAELNRRRLLEQFASVGSPPAAPLNLWKLILPLILFLGVTFAAVPFGLSYLHRATSHLNQQADEGDLQVTQLIEKVEDQLADAEKERLRKNRAALFRVKSFDLEVNFVVKQGTSQKGTTTYNIVTVDNQLDSSLEMTHTLTLHMEVPPPQPGQSLIPDGQLPVGPITTIGPDAPPEAGGVSRNPLGKPHEKPHQTRP